jgi:YHS domain-containing protein
MKRTFLTGMILAIAVTAAFADGKTLVNLDKQGIALQGYDAVGFFTEKRPVKGDPNFQSTYKGARYYFASEANKQVFDANPAKYEPQFGGFCAYGVSRGYTVPIKIEAFQILNDRLLMQYDFGAQKEFNKDPQSNLRKADENWPKLVEKQGR